MAEEPEPTFANELCMAAADMWPFAGATFLRWFDNIVYRVLVDRTVCYLRITPASRRTTRQIESELDVLGYLHDKEFPANVPLLAHDGQLCREIERDGQCFTACVFSACSGASFEQQPPTDLSAFCRSVGQTLGRLHTVLRMYKRPSEFTRPAWNEERWDQFESVIPESETAARELHSDLRQSWNTWEKSDGFGLVHGDFTVRNMHCSRHAISLFDFDCCCDHWYAYDIACFLHAFSRRPLEQRRVVFEGLLDGYAETGALSDKILEQIPVCSKIKLLRGFLVYAIKYGLDSTSSEVHRLFELRRQEFSEPACWPPPNA